MADRARIRRPNLALDNPALAAQWHPVKNGDLTPADIPACWNSKAWWACPECAHEWEAYVSNRNKAANPRGCPQCASRSRFGFRKPPPGGSLAEVRPDVAAEWHPNRNGDLTPSDLLPGSSKRSLWWQCPRGHEWQTSPSMRTSQNTRCPKCIPQGTSRFEIELFHELRAAGCLVVHDLRLPEGTRWRQVDIAAPEWHLAIEFDGNLHHRTSQSRDSEKTADLTALGWTVVRVRQGLEALTDRDLCIPITATVLEAAQLLLAHLAYLGYPVNADAYVRAGSRMGAAAAAAAYKERVQRSLASDHPELVCDWDTNTNGTGPEAYGSGSQERVWWRCHSCGHQWKAAVAGRANGSGPGCATCKQAKRKQPKPPPPGQSLADKYPVIAAEVAADLNEGRTGADFMPASQWKIWWRCARGHAWIQKVADRTIKGAGCKECRKMDAPLRYRPDEFEDSLAADPEIAAAWHPTRNEGRTPRDYKITSDYRVWWQCPDCGREWESSVRSRTKQRGGCRTCVFADKRGHRTPPPGGSAAELFPRIVPNWHPTKNGELNPWNLVPAANVTVHWLCERGHETSSLLSSRTTGGASCPECERHDRWATYHAERAHVASFAAARPDLVDQWDREANPEGPEEVRKESRTLVWWRCPTCGHRWQASPVARSRAEGTGCRSCILKARHEANSAAPGHSLADRFPEIAAEFAAGLNGDWTPERLRPFSNRVMWWRCTAGHEWEAAVNKRTRRGTGCPLCRSAHAPDSPPEEQPLQATLW
nr:zinc-ribbon domain-containing protein [Glycomyces paridis]